MNAARATNAASAINAANALNATNATNSNKMGMKSLPDDHQQWNEELESL